MSPLLPILRPDSGGQGGRTWLSLCPPLPPSLTDCRVGPCDGERWEKEQRERGRECLLGACAVSDLAGV